MAELALACACGKVTGKLTNASPDNGTRVICYCGDCQAFARFLGRGGLMDDWGGTQIFQVPPAWVTFEAPPNGLACIRLSKEGLYRWSCAECRSMIANSLTPNVAFVGVSTKLITEPDLDAVLGPIRGHIQQKTAWNGGPQQPANNFAVLRRAVWKFITWKMRKLTMPHPFFRDLETPIVTPKVLTIEERVALG